MRKILLLTLAAAGVFAAGAQKTAKLTSIKSTDGIEESLFSYDDDCHVTKICQGDAINPEYNTVRVLTYNDKGLNISEQLYQDMYVTGSWELENLRYNSLIEYTYDEAGMLVERRNYNNWSNTDEPDFQLGGVTTYEYNADGTLDKSCIYWDAEKKNLGQEVEYEYDADGRLVKMNTYMASWNTGDMELMGYTEYTYLENGLRNQEIIYYSDYTTGKFVTDTIIEYSYDESGNIVMKTVMGASGTINDRIEYTYLNPDEAPASAGEVAYPVDLESAETNFIYESFRTLVPESYEEWVLSMATDELEYLATYEYGYESVNVGVNGVAADRNTFGILAFSKDSIRLDGVGDARVNVCDMSGRVLISTKANQGAVDISALPSGQYCIYTAAGATKFVK